MRVSIQVNGTPRTLDLEGNETLLDLLRDRLGLSGTKRDCDEGECGECTLQVDGLPVYACILLAAACRDREVLTIEGLAHEGGLSLLQHSLLESGALACGFCAPAWVMALKPLIEAYPNAGEALIREALAGVRCRCDPDAARLAAALGARRKGSIRS